MRFLTVSMRSLAGASDFGKFSYPDKCGIRAAQLRRAFLLGPYASASDSGRSAKRLRVSAGCYESRHDFSLAVLRLRIHGCC